MTNHTQNETVSPQDLAQFILSPTIQAAALYEDYDVLGVSKDAGYQALADGLKLISDQINQGDQTHLKNMLAAQAIMLDALFGQLCRRALVNEYRTVHTQILGMALKAQRQSARTIETLTLLLDPKRALVVQNNVHLSNQTLSVNPHQGDSNLEQKQDRMIELVQDAFGPMDQKNITNELLAAGPN